MSKFVVWYRICGARKRLYILLCRYLVLVYFHKLTRIVISFAIFACIGHSHSSLFDRYKSVIQSTNESMFAVVINKVFVIYYCTLYYIIIFDVLYIDVNRNSVGNYTQ